MTLPGHCHRYVQDYIRIVKWACSALNAELRMGLIRVAEP